MKKAYTRPEIAFESFSLSENIAASSSNCSRKLENLQDGICGYQFGSKVIFTMTTEGCMVKITDGSPLFDGLCYHIPNDNNKLFNS
jgi:hypothetical protein